MELNILKDVIVPIIIGVLSSVVFLFLASHVKPRLVISEHIARVSGDASRCMGGGYAVKVVNKSKRSATEVKARLALVRKFNVQGGQINRTDDFPLIKDWIFELPARNKKEPEDSAFRFITHENIELDWIGDNYILFSVYAKDSLTGFGKVFTRPYYLKEGILKGGEFAIGHSMEIV
jgi:hypothetical protein